jgi:uncharacterized protein YecE (DUF72 family)
VSGPQIRLGTCAFTASGWSGVFYPKGLKSADYLSWYAEHFDTVEIDSSFYGCPTAKTVSNWKAKTPQGFIFSVKVPQQITHEKVLVACQPEFETFVETVRILDEKLGPIVFQFPWFDSWQIKDRHAFTDRLLPFVKILPKDFQFAVEIRNRKWLDAEFADMLRSFNIALVLQDIPSMPGPSELKFDPITAKFLYVRLLGNWKQIETQTQQWDKVVEDKTEKVASWVTYCRQVQRRGVKQYVYANNHYEGYSPATVDKFRALWQKQGGAELEKPTRMRREGLLFDDV